MRLIVICWQRGKVRHAKRLICGGSHKVIYRRGSFTKGKVKFHLNQKAAESNIMIRPLFYIDAGSAFAFQTLLKNQCINGNAPGSGEADADCGCHQN